MRMTSRSSSQFSGTIDAGAKPRTLADRRRTDTRKRIQEVALELFAAQGYDRTSLRAIAERLQVTKAALYYHFKTKEDILQSVFEDWAATVDELVAWGRMQPQTLETRREVLRRYAELTTRGRWRVLVRFLQENQATLRELDPENARAGTIQKSILPMIQLVRDPEGGLADQLRAALAVIVLHLGSAGNQMPGPSLIEASDEEIEAAALEVSLDLIARRTS